MAEGRHRHQPDHRDTQSLQTAKLSRDSGKVSFRGEDGRVDAVDHRARRPGGGLCGGSTGMTEESAECEEYQSAGCAKREYHSGKVRKRLPPPQLWGVGGRGRFKFGSILIRHPIIGPEAILKNIECRNDRTIRTIHSGSYVDFATVRESKVLVAAGHGVRA